MIVHGLESDGDTDATRLTHVDDQGRVRMVDVSHKALTPRVAVAKCTVTTTVGMARAIAALQQEGDVLEAARFAGILAAKRTASLIPLCHPIHISGVAVDIVAEPECFAISARTEIIERTGVEMEALTACAIAALAVVSALVKLDPMASVQELTLWHKSGGRSGIWERTSREGTLIHNARPANSP